MVDRTYIAVKRQLSAMNATSYEVGVGPVFDKAGKQIVKEDGEPVFFIRSWDSATIFKSLSWLKNQNMNGANIYIRPNGSQGLLLMDDLTISTLQRIEADGLIAACVTETSPLNYQVWIRVSYIPIENALATATARVLAERYNTDLNSADWRHFGRLSGFTNRKPEHIQSNGRFPFVLLRNATGRGVSDDLSHSLINDAYQWISERKSKEKSNPKRVISSSPPGLDPVGFFSSELAGLLERYGGGLDASKADWMIVNKMIQKGYSEDEIKQAMYEASYDLQARKKGHIEDYINRTLKAASS